MARIIEIDMTGVMSSVEWSEHRRRTRMPRRHFPSSHSRSRSIDYQIKELEWERHGLMRDSVSYRYAHDISVYESTPYSDAIEKLGRKISEMMLDRDLERALGACFKVG